jgi:integrase
MACVKKIGDRYRVDYRDKDGKRYRTFFDRKVDATNHLDEKKAEIKAGTFLPPKKIPAFKDVANDWFAGKQASNYRPATLQQWQTHLDLHLVPAIGDRRLDQIDVGVIEKTRNDLLAAKLAPQTVNKLLTTASAVFKFAVKRKLATSNPAQLADRARVGAAEIAAAGKGKRSGMEVEEDEVLAPEEIARLIQHAEAGFFRTLILTAALTGARHDELLALTWGDVDLEAGKLTVRRSLSWAKLKGEETRPRFFEPKSKAGRRTLPLADQIKHALKVWKLQCPQTEEKTRETLGSGLVFPWHTGGPAHRSDVLRRGLYPALDRAKLRRVDMHSLRHSFASALIANGSPVTEVQYLMGHSKPSTTLRVYSHWFKQTETDAVSKLAVVLCSVAASGAERVA